MPLRDHFRSPLDDVHSWDELHGGWPMMIGMLVLSAPAAMGQSRLQQQGYQPVEQLVDDMEMLRGSLRRVDAGLQSRGGQGTSVYRRSGAGDKDKLFFIAPGVVAEYDRSDYMLVEVERDDFRIFQIVAPNTVFHIGLPDDQPAARQVSPLSRALRADQSAPQPDAQRQPVRTGPDPWASYRAFRHRQQAMVMQALDQLDQQ
ncbi:MAG: hypothetical protein KY476_22565 [Planctomycetes bacterium]|nr:hypothetical protein [Planctomycetota bacterium]